MFLLFHFEQMKDWVEKKQKKHQTINSNMTSFFRFVNKTNERVIDWV
jgi:hypothetical protein